MKKLMIAMSVAAALGAAGFAVAQSPRDGAAPAHRPMWGDANGDKVVTKAELTADLQKRFAAMDLNGDGKVTPEERAQARDKRFDARFAKMDANGDGQLSKAELKAAHEGRDRDGRRGYHGKGPGEGRGMGAAGPHDRMTGEKDGVLTRDAFMARPLAMFDRADANKDGKVTAEERQAARPDRGMRGHRRGPGGDMPPPPPPPADEAR